MTKLSEGNLDFEFLSGNAVKFDNYETNPKGTSCVDFLVDMPKMIYFIEVKDYQNPNQDSRIKTENYQMLLCAMREKPSRFCMKIGEKLKDSLLRQYALGENFDKRVEYLLFINFDGLTAQERGVLQKKIEGHIPTGLNKERFTAFKTVSFKIVDKTKLQNQYKITVSEKY
jgi:hypothetical protein